MIAKTTKLTKQALTSIAPRCCDPVALEEGDLQWLLEVLR